MTPRPEPTREQLVAMSAGRSSGVTEKAARQLSADLHRELFDLRQARLRAEGRA
jgi:hypothetical protein